MHTRTCTDCTIHTRVIMCMIYLQYKVQYSINVCISTSWDYASRCRFFCCIDHNQYHETFSCTKYLLCVLSSECSALNFIFIESVLIVFNTRTFFCCCQTQNGVSPVSVASRNGHTKVVDLLIKAGADIHLASTEVHVSLWHAIILK